MIRPRPIPTAMVLVAFGLICPLIATVLMTDSGPRAMENRDSSEVGLSAFRAVASVLTSPRCLNCHLEGQSPLQGDDGRPHNMNVRRGDDGRGSPAMRCTNCHQSTNVEFAHAPPGAPDWRLPAANSPMAWRGLSTGDLCRTLKDLSKNGGRSLSSLLEHVTADQIVNWGWNPGSGRTMPPLSHQQFVDKFREWVDSGAPCEPLVRTSP
jgi:hypothetical protein